MEQLMEPITSTAEYNAAIKKSVLKEIAKFRRSQKEATALKISRLTSLKGLAETEEIQKKAKPLTEPAHENAAGHTSALGLSFCYAPPYTGGHGFYHQHPFAHSTGMEEDAVDKIFSLVNMFTGEISLACLGGQYFDFFYGGANPFLNGSLGYYNSVCGGITHTIELPSPFQNDTKLNIEVKTELPADYNKAFKLVPGNGPDELLRNLTGAEGYLIVVASYMHEGGTVSKSAPWNNFLSAWQNDDETEPNVGPYSPNQTSLVSLTIPGGVTKVHISCLIILNAHSMIDNNSDRPATYQSYSLIDFRAPETVPLHRIFYDPVFGMDHTTPGAIKIKNICVDFEPALSTADTDILTA